MFTHKVNIMILNVLNIYCPFHNTFVYLTKQINLVIARKADIILLVYVLDNKINADSNITILD